MKCPQDGETVIGVELPDAGDGLRPRLIPGVRRTTKTMSLGNRSVRVAVLTSCLVALATFAQAQRAIPDDNLAYPVLKVREVVKRAQRRHDRDYGRKIA